TRGCWIGSGSSSRAVSSTTTPGPLGLPPRPEHTAPVVPGDVGDLRCAETRGGQSVEDRGHRRGIESGRQRGAVEIRPQGNVGGPDLLGHVERVLRDQRKRRVWVL